MADDILKKLDALGCDTEGAVERFMGDKEIYIECLKDLLEDAAIKRLEIALKGKNVKTAFENAHTLKGITGNMGINPLYKIIAEIVEPLREGKTDGVLEHYYEYVAENERIKKEIF